MNKYQRESLPFVSDVMEQDPDQHQGQQLQQHRVEEARTQQLSHHSLGRRSGL